MLVVVGVVKLVVVVGMRWVGGARLQLLAALLSPAAADRVVERKLGAAPAAGQWQRSTTPQDLQL